MQLRTVKIQSILLSIITTNQFKANCTWSSWKESDCTTTCGSEAFRTRSRSIIKEAKNGGSCEGKNREIVSCNLDDCPTSKFLSFFHMSFHKYYFSIFFNSNELNENGHHDIIHF